MDGVTRVVILVFWFCLTCTFQRGGGGGNRSLPNRGTRLSSKLRVKYYHGFNDASKAFVGGIVTYFSEDLECHYREVVLELQVH